MRFSFSPSLLLSVCLIVYCFSLHLLVSNCINKHHLHCECQDGTGIQMAQVHNAVGGGKPG
ncbi:hypothetical protein BDZ91DRAFT_728190 [Kalaharituber pfeilii]|nr:hypothetical protein BDZ91DRAFT_728190 [Kalaharituber pfeilii]